MALAVTIGVAAMALACGTASAQGQFPEPKDPGVCHTVDWHLIMELPADHECTQRMRWLASRCVEKINGNDVRIIDGKPWEGGRLKTYDCTTDVFHSETYWDEQHRVSDDFKYCPNDGRADMKWEDSLGGWNSLNVSVTSSVGASFFATASLEVKAEYGQTVSYNHTFGESVATNVQPYQAAWYERSQMWQRVDSILIVRLPDKYHGGRIHHVPIRFNAPVIEPRTGSAMQQISSHARPLTATEIHACGGAAGPVRLRIYKDGNEMVCMENQAGFFRMVPCDARRATVQTWWAIPTSTAENPRYMLRQADTDSCLSALPGEQYVQIHSCDITNPYHRWSLSGGKEAVELGKPTTIRSEHSGLCMTAPAKPKYQWTGKWDAWEPQWVLVGYDDDPPPAALTTCGAVDQVLRLQ